MAPQSSVFARRLKQARQRLALTQEQVAALAGIDEFSASARISQYETGKHVPSYEIARNLAAALRVSVEFLYAAEDATAEMLLVWSAMTAEQRAGVLLDLQSRSPQD